MPAVVMAEIVAGGAKEVIGVVKGGVGRGPSAALATASRSCYDDKNFSPVEQRKRAQVRG